MSIHLLAQAPEGWLAPAHMTPFQFPGGEYHLKDVDPDEKSAGAVLYGSDTAELVQLGLWADAIHQLGQKAIAYIPYFPAARADRGVPFGGKIYADLVNGFNLDEVVIFDPHSPVIVELLNNVRVVDSAALVAHAVGDVEAAGYVGVIAPDKGAVPRAQRAADALGLPLFKATKERDFETGKLLKFEVEELPAEGRLLIVDDICDGGGTFLGLADVTGLPKERLSLWVSHGIFSGRANLLTEKFSRIYTTDSHPGARREDVGALVTPIFPHLFNK